MQKKLYKIIPDSPLKEITFEERHYYIKNILDGVISIDDIYNYLDFSNKEDTRRLIKYFLKIVALLKKYKYDL